MRWELVVKRPICRFDDASGDAEALARADTLARYLKGSTEILAENGRFLAGHPHMRPVIHFHHCQMTVQALPGTTSITNAGRTLQSNG